MNARHSKNPHTCCTYGSGQKNQPLIKQGKFQTGCNANVRYCNAKSIKYYYNQLQAVVRL
jgi:hypothetical protein